jgi:hypothetical protein
MLMLDRETLSMLVGFLLIALASVFLATGYFGFQEFLTLIFVSLAVMGLGRFGSDFPGVLHRLLRAGSAVQPLVSINDLARKITIYTLDEPPRSVKKLADKLARMSGYTLEWRRHAGFRLLDDWTPMQSGTLTGPENAGESKLIPVRISGDEVYIFRITYRHKQYLGARVISWVQEKDGGGIFYCDDALKEGGTVVHYVPAYRFGKGEEYQVYVSDIADRYAPSVVDYSVDYVKTEAPGYKVLFNDREVKPGEQGYVDYIEFPSGGRFVFRLFSPLGASVRLTLFATRTVNDVPVTVFKSESIISAGETVAIEIPNATYGSFYFRIDSREGVAGILSFIYEKYEAPPQPPEHPPEAPIVVTGGDEIAPEHKQWLGSLGYEFGGLYWTNEHVIPQKDMKVLHTGSGKVIGVSVSEPAVRTVSWLDIILNWIFGKKLPTNKVDRMGIKPAEGVAYQKFMPYPAVIAEPRVGMTVHSRGRTSGTRQGAITDVNGYVMVIWPHNGRPAIFEDVVVMDMTSGPGDSGSPVVCMDGIVGLLFAGDTSGRITLAVKAKNIHA